MKVVAVSDTDSYVKWAAALIADPRVDGELVVLDTEVAVSDAQLRAALAGSGLDPRRVRRARFDELPSLLRDADVVLAAARGPLARVVAREAARLDPSPVIATGLPGISIPATWRALNYRRHCDMFVLHSHREIREFRSLAEERGFDHRFALATLPFARRVAELAPAARGTDLVFAAQAIVPARREDRACVARILIAAAEADPARRVVLKLRGRPGEHETHREEDSYPDLLGAIGGVPSNLVVSYAPMGEVLEGAEGLVTVSSTAAVEAAAQGVPVIALDTFGVDEQHLNTVFSGSGLLAGADAVIARELRHPDPAWLTDNYFHDAADDTWLDLLSELVARRAAGALPAKEAPFRIGGALRDAWERRLAMGRSDRSLAGGAAYAIGLPTRAVLRASRIVRRLITEQPAARAPGAAGSRGSDPTARPRRAPRVVGRELRP